MNTSDDNFYKCLFYGILFIFLTIILLLILKNNKKNKEKYADPQLPIQLTPSSNLIQIDPLTGDLSELNTNQIITVVNNIVKNFMSSPTFDNATLTNATLKNTNTSTFTGSVNINDTLYTNSIVSTVDSQIKLNDSIAGSSSEISLVCSYLNLLNNKSNTSTSKFPILKSNPDGNLFIAINNVPATVLETNWQQNTIESKYTLVINDLTQNFGQNFGNLPNMATTNKNTVQGKNVVMSMGTYYGSNIDQFSWSYFGGNKLVIENKNGVPTPLAYSIICGNRVLASAFDAYSDERIKNNITDIDTKKALDIIRQIQPKRYNYKDIIKKGDKPEWGFIAQQVKSLVENSTNLVSEFIPDIYELAQVLNSYSNIIKLDITTTINFEINEKIRLIYKDGKCLDTKITGILDNYTFTIEENINQQQIFVYGREIHDLHTLNKDCIFTISTAALKEVDKELQKEKKIRQHLEDRIINLENLIEKQGNDIKELYNIIQKSKLLKK